MKFNNKILLQYISQAPLALAFERYLECLIYTQLHFEPPILDVGCGEGLFANILFAEQINTGIDPNPSELTRARELKGYQEVILCRGDNIPKPAGTFNTIYSNSVLEHIPELSVVLQEIHRLLSPGGRFYFTVPSNYFDHYSVIFQLLTILGLKKIAEDFRVRYNRFWKHYHYYNLKEWRRIAIREGFQVIDAYSYNPKLLCLLNDLLVPLSIFSLITKRLTNRWVLFPGLRKIILYPLFLIVEPLLNSGIRAEKGGLVFLALTKE